MAIEELDKVKVTCNFELGDGTQYQNVYYYIREGTDPFSDSAIVASIKALLEGAYAELVTLVTTDVTEQLSFVDRIEWVTDKWKVTENIGTFTPTFAPSATGDALPFMSAPFVVFKTTRPKTVGKKFLFPFDEAWQDATILLSGAVNAMVAYAAEILGDVPLSPGNFLTPGVPRTRVEAWYSFQVAVVNDIIGSQKRRRPGVGA